MDNNQKKFGTYVFLSTFARNLIEVFVPIILYKFGFAFKEVLLYYLLVSAFSLVLSYPYIYLSNKYSNKLVGFIGIFSFVIVQILLNNIQKSKLFLVLLSLVFSLYKRGYWISRRYYNLRVIRKENISSTYSLISIINHIGVIFSSYIGSIFLDFVSISVLTTIAITLFVISVIPLYLLNFEHKDKTVKLEPLKTFIRVPKRNLYLFGTYELIDVVKFLFNLYLVIYVKDNYQTIGILNLFTNLATILFAYFYGKKINEEKNFLNLSIFFVVTVYLFKLSFTSYILVLISFLEGIFVKMYELSIQKEFYSLSKKFEYHNYNFMYEVTESFSRTLMAAILYFFASDLKIMIIIVLLTIISASFIKFKGMNIRDYRYK
ncbi:MAG: MFS transporter [Bacilli bacterium]|nr:MFS transporter [Bacilli bacterium]